MSNLFFSYFVLVDDLLLSLFITITQVELLARLDLNILNGIIKSLF